MIIGGYGFVKKLKIMAQLILNLVDPEIFKSKTWSVIYLIVTFLLISDGNGFNGLGCFTVSLF